MVAGRRRPCAALDREDPLWRAAGVGTARTPDVAFGPAYAPVASRAGRVWRSVVAQGGRCALRGSAAAGRSLGIAVRRFAEAPIPALLVDCCAVAGDVRRLKRRRRRLGARGGET